MLQICDNDFVINTEPINVSICGEIVNKHSNSDFRLMLYSSINEFIPIRYEILDQFYLLSEIEHNSIQVPKTAH